MRGEAYDAFVDEFVQAVEELYPKCCIQWEDFANINAVPILARYRDRTCTYNDDIQGTAAVALAGIYGALRISGQKLSDQRFLFLGAGSAATGIAELISQAMVMEGLTLQQARGRNNLFDVDGLLTTSRKLPGISAAFRDRARRGHQLCRRDQGLEADRNHRRQYGAETVQSAGHRGHFRVNERPIIFPYSNPTSRSECTAEEAYTWSNGRAIFASGSPFPPLNVNGKHFVPGQGNNVYIFPAMGMAVYATEASRVTDDMFIVAAKAVAEQVGEDSLQMGLIYPPQSRILTASLHVAERVAANIFDSGLARIARPKDVGRLIADKTYVAAYRRVD